MEEKKNEKEVKKVESKNIKKEETKKEDKKEAVKKETVVNNNKKVENKKFETVKKENKKVGTKSKGKNGIILAIVLGIILVLAIAILAIALTAKTPENAVNGMMNSLKSGDFEKVNEFVNYNEIINDSEITDSDNLNEQAQELLFDKLSWKINKITKEGDTASVEIQVTNKNFKTIIANYMQKALKTAFSGGEFNESEMTNYLLEELRNEQVETTTETKTIKVQKQDNDWKVEVDTELIDSLLPGLNETVNSLS